MNMLRALRRPVLIAFAALVPVVIGCDSATEPPQELVGTWNATSLVVDGYEFMDDGMTLRYTLSSNGEYSYTVTNDLLGFCEVGASCSESGDFSVSGNRITFDPGEDWEETYTYTLSGSTLTISATFGGATFTFTFQRQ